MCVIVVSNKKVDDEILRKCWKSNPSGAGYSICNGDNVFFRRGIMEYKEFIELYMQEVKDNVWHTIHFRIPSAGDTGDVMTHPFPIDKTYLENLSELVKKNNNTIGYKIIRKQCGLKPDMKSGITQATLSHNGTMHSLGQGDLSDSFCTAYILSNIEDKSVYDKVLDMVGGRTNCFAITLPDRIKMLGNFTKKDDIYYSNMHWDRVDVINYEWNTRGNRYFNNVHKTAEGFIKGSTDEFIEGLIDNDKGTAGYDSIYCAIADIVMDRKDCVDCIDSTEYLCDISNSGVFIYCPKEKIQVEISTSCVECLLNGECFAREQKLI